MLAALPWYDLLELQESTDAFWRILARQLRDLGVDDAPESLCRDIHY